MAGRLVDAWEYTWAEIWQPLALIEDTPPDLYMQVYPELADALKQPQQPNSQDKAEWDSYAVAQKYRFDADSEASSDPSKAAEQFQLWMPQDFKGDHALARALESVFEVLDGIDPPGLAREFYDLTGKFLRCHNIRYRLLKPFELRPHTAGLFSTLVREIETRFAGAPELLALLNEFEHALKNAGKTHAEADIKTCIGKASNLAEGISGRHPQAKGGAFSNHCDSVDCWPHDRLKAVFESIYGFCSGYPGVRHAGSQNGVRRELNPRDGVVSALVLLSSAGYFIPNLDVAEIVG